VTAEILRTISPTRILADAVASIAKTERGLQILERLGGPGMSEAQRRAIERVKSARVGRRVPEDQRRRSPAAFWRCTARG
jgi:hypothetical protein